MSSYPRWEQCKGCGRKIDLYQSFDGYCGRCRVNILFFDEPCPRRKSGGGSDGER